MDACGTAVAILSYPSAPVGGIGEEGRAAARGQNMYAKEICEKYPCRFGFFGTLPLLDDIDGKFVLFCPHILSNNVAPVGAIAEIAYCLDVLGADGIGLISSYGHGADASQVDFNQSRHSNI